MVTFDIPGYVENADYVGNLSSGITYYTPEVTALEVPFTQLGGTGITLDVDLNAVNEVRLIAKQSLPQRFKLNIRSMTMNNAKPLGQWQ